MRALKLACTAMAVLLPVACAGGEDDDQIVPSLAYEYDSLAGALQVMARSDEECDALNGGDAWLLESDPEPVGYRAAFVCR